MNQPETKASGRKTSAGSLLGFLIRSVIAGLALAFVILYLWPSISERFIHQADVLNNAPPALVSFADAVDRTAPSVVSIYTRTVELQQVSPRLQKLLGSSYVSRSRQDMGSGVLVSEDGYILTNNHVISRVQNISVGLWDGRFATAQVVGSDPETDLAVLKIELSGLPAAQLAEDANVRVGDVVLAIGNAFGLSHTVTMGIVSATGRNDLRSVLYEDFIQTDAAINAGNSGGALINYRGEVIGINTRNLGQMQGAQNIGFAIPIVMAKDVMQQIVENGTVRRGSIGALFSDLPLSLQTDGSSVRRGIQVRDVTLNGPAWNAGIRPGDILLSIDGADVDDARALLLMIAQRQPGERVEFQVSRDTEIFETYATLIQQPPLR
ncbi:MAG: trypsin-like peptidase domain-containing protein [Xanthomonadales bacterium]|nr:trypsin-like peptidase domain-containing protein [Xanthomonadales bacterium]